MSQPVVTQPTSLKEKVEKLANDVLPLMENLYSRWLDESQYEDINDYAQPIRPLVLAAGALFVKMSKRPFGFTASFPTTTGSVRVQYSMTTHQFRWKKVS